MRLRGGHGHDGQAVPQVQVVDRHGAGDGLAAGVRMSAGQWFDWLIWFAILFDIGVWAVMVWVMALRTLL
jgi:hypothetical protein